jgi:formamidopyrimidine-DNA glycosylase
MPELPEVEHLRRTIEPRLLGRTVTRVEVRRADVCEVWTTAPVSVGSNPTPATSPDPARGPSMPRPASRIPSPDAATLHAALLLGATFTATQRRGKELALIAASPSQPPRVLCVHLGMTGQLRWHAALPPHNPKEHLHIVWELDGGGSTHDSSVGTVMTFADPRRFGGLAGLDSLAALEDRWATLGPDALTTPLDDLAEALITELGRANRAVKAALLDQRIIAGVGNIYADEALFAARIHPRKLARRLSPDRVRLLAAHIREILTRAVDAGGSTLRDYVNADGDRGQAQTLHQVYGRAGLPCPACGLSLQTGQIAQRTTVWCRACQRDKAIRP